MRTSKALPLAIAVAAIGVAPQAFAYSAVANIQFSWGANNPLIPGFSGQAGQFGWTAQGPGNTLTSMTNATYFTTLTSGANSVSFYNPDFAKAGDATGWCPGVNQAQYSCQTAATNVSTPIADGGPGGAATGQLTATATTLTGTLTVINTNDEGAGPAPGTTAATGYNIRTADFSPFNNVWWGVSSSATLTVNLTGTFSASSWQITGGTVEFSDPAFQCYTGSTSPTLCNPSTVGGGFQSDASMLSWGMDQGFGPGTGVSEIQVYDRTSTNLLATLGGVLANISVSGAGAITTVQGEYRSAGGSSSGCDQWLTWGTRPAQGPTAADPVNRIRCGTLQTGRLNVTGTIVPVPAAVWLFGSALGILGVARRKLSS